MGGSACRRSPLVGCVVLLCFVFVGGVDPNFFKEVKKRCFDFLDMANSDRGN